MKTGARQLRIIAGKWRGRKIGFPEGTGLRPTPDRIRETLFNWLQPVITGAQCLDLFAGSGALSLEALSRGAARVVMVDNNTHVVARLGAELQRLAVGADEAQVVHGDATTYLQNTAPHPYDIVFLDPPYQSGLAAPCMRLIDQGEWLSPHARIYIETARDDKLQALPPRWHILHSKRAGQLGYHLAGIDHDATH